MPSEGGRAIPVLTIVGIVVFLVTVAVLIRSYPNDSQVQAVPAPATSGAGEATVEAATDRAPIGGVATGGGGTAGDSSNTALPVLAGLAAVTVAAAAGLGLRRSRRPGAAVA